MTNANSKEMKADKGDEDIDLMKTPIGKRPLFKPVDYPFATLNEEDLSRTVVDTFEILPFR